MLRVQRGFPIGSFLWAFTQIYLKRMEQPRLRQVRAETRTVLMEWLQQVAQGKGGLLFLTGERGAGRTTLMRKAIAELPQIGLVPAEGTCRDEQAERVGCLLLPYWNS